LVIVLDFSTIETDSSSERIESRFTETESMSSDSIPDFSEYVCTSLYFVCQVSKLQILS